MIRAWFNRGRCTLRGVVLVTCCAAACGKAAVISVDASTSGSSTDASPDHGSLAVSIELRVVNACSAAIDLYAGGKTPLLQDVQPGQVTTYVAATVDPAQGALEVRRAGDGGSVPPVATSPLHPMAGDRFTVALAGSACAVTPLWEHWGAALPGALRVRFVDTIGKDTPTRLFTEGEGGTFAQVAAVDPLGDSGPEGVVVTVAPADRDSVRVQVGAELSAGAGTPGYQLPASVLTEGAQLFVFSRLLALLVVAGDGPPAQIHVADGDPPGTIRVNPSLAILNAIPDLCGSGLSQLSFQDSTGHALGAIDVRFGLQSRLSLPPTATGHTLVAAPSMGCAMTGGGALSSGPLDAGARYIQVVFGSAAAGAPTGSLRKLTLSDRPQPSGPSIAFANAATGAPPIDLVNPLDLPDGGFNSGFNGGSIDGGTMATFVAVPFGGLSSWLPAPTQDYSLTVAQRPVVSASYPSSQSRLIVAIGNWSDPTPSGVRLWSYRISDL